MVAWCEDCFLEELGMGGDATFVIVVFFEVLSIWP